ncbi:protein BTG2-like [Eleutherodactylus coqui]|uniref:protein BTG2-like n=1 Tax=Eleutherodactylus coqui TaxID=57060 RepID=UPI003462DECE
MISVVTCLLTSLAYRTLIGGLRSGILRAVVYKVAAEQFFLTSLAVGCLGSSVRIHLLSAVMSVGSSPEPLPEITAAVSFLSGLLRSRLSEQQLQGFGGALRETLIEHYRHHWFPDRPAKGSGYRCIRINHKMDPIISKVAARIKMSNLLGLLPKELTLWVDPYEVSYRIGEDGSICVLYEASLPRGPLTCKSELLGCSSVPSQYLMMVGS